MATVPLSKMGADVSRRMDRMTKELKRTTLDTTRKGAVEAKKAHAAVIRRDTGGDSRLSGVGKKGAKVGVRFDEFRKGAILIRATGPLHLRERDTSAHAIPRRRRRGRKRFAVIPGFGREGGPGVFPAVRHPGTRGVATWARGQRRAQPRALEAIRRENRRVVFEAFR